MDNNNMKKPNFLIILADDMGFSDAGCYGGEINTDNLDKLAENGLRFTQFYNTARCWPSRSCIMTGYYAQQVRMDPPHGDSLPRWTSLLPHYLSPLGYRCYHSGKWHINNAPMPVRDGGFDKSYMLNDHNRFFTPKKHREDDQPLPPVKEEDNYYAPTAFADHAIKCLQEHNQEYQPFFEYLAFTSPHFPLHAPQEDIDKYRGEYDEGWDVVRKRRWQKLQDMGIVNCDLPPLEPEVIPGWNLPPDELKEKIGSGEVAKAIPWEQLTEEEQQFQAEKMAIHAAMIDRMDQEIGRVINQIKEMGEFDNTVIMFMSDNGASAEQIIRGDEHDPCAAPGSGETFLCLGPGWSTSSNTPFRLHKSWVHEGGIATPFIIHWPEQIKDAGELRYDQAHLIDILPTVLDIVGEDVAEAKKDDAPDFPGQSLLPAIVNNESLTRDYLYFHHMENRAIRVGDWKLVADGAEGPWELYDLSQDRCECNNLVDKYPDKVDEMNQMWQQCEDQFRE